MSILAAPCAAQNQETSSPWDLHNDTQRRGSVDRQGLGQDEAPETWGSSPAGGGEGRRVLRAPSEDEWNIGGGWLTGGTQSSPGSGPGGATTNKGGGGGGGGNGGGGGGGGGGNDCDVPTDCGKGQVCCDDDLDGEGKCVPVNKCANVIPLGGPLWTALLVVGGIGMGAWRISSSGTGRSGLEEGEGN